MSSVIGVRFTDYYDVSVRSLSLVPAVIRWVLALLDRCEDPLSSSILYPVSSVIGVRFTDDYDVSVQALCLVPAVIRRVLTLLDIARKAHRARVQFSTTPHPGTLRVDTDLCRREVHPSLCVLLLVRSLPSVCLSDCSFVCV